MSYGFMSIVPPLAAIVIALKFRNVYAALASGIFLAFTIIASGNIFIAIDNAFTSMIGVFADGDNVIIFITLMLLGALILMMEESGGINGFVDYLTNKKNLIKSKRGANLFTWIIGVLVFTSGTLSCLITGAVSRPINDALKVSHEKSAFIVHTTSTPVCVLIPLSGWGAYMIGLLEAQGVENATAVLFKSIPLNFYSIIAVLGILLLILIGKDFGKMKKAEMRADETGLLDAPKKSVDSKESYTVSQSNEVTNKKDEKTSSPLNLVIPLVVMIGMIVGSMYFTGGGKIIEGDGYKAILWGITLSVLVASIMYLKQKIFNVKEISEYIAQGSGSMLPMVMILVLAFSMGGITKELGTGQYLGNLFSGLISPALIAVLIFVISQIISFSTGTSMGTMAVMMPLAMPMAMAMGASIPLVASAVWGGSIFGDHSSPISDSTYLSCSTTGCDPIDHIKSQLPYTITFGLIAMVFYIIAGFIL